MESLGVASRRPEQARDRVFGDVDQTSGGLHPAPFIQMVDDRLRIVLRDFGVEQRGPASLGELLAACTAPQEPNAILAVDFAYGQIVLARATKLLAFGVDTR